MNKRLFYDLDRDKLYSDKQVIDRSPLNPKPKQVTKHSTDKTGKNVRNVFKAINRFTGKQLKNVSKSVKNFNMVEKVDPPHDPMNEYSWLTPQERKKIERR